MLSTAAHLIDQVYLRRVKPPKFEFFGILENDLSLLFIELPEGVDVTVSSVNLYLFYVLLW